MIRTTVTQALFAAASSALVLAACTGGSYAGPVESTPGPLAAPPGKGDPQSDLAFVKQACGSCHAVEPLAISPNPRAPNFADVVNSPGLTADTLDVWLRNAHNYPSQMSFTLDNDQVATIERHLLRLRDPDYVKPVS